MELNYTKKEAVRTSVDLTFPKICNEKACCDYFLSKCMTRKNKAAIIDNINRNATVENYFATKKLSDAEQRLKDRKELAAKQRQDLDEQWKDLRKKEDHLRKNMIYFDKFVHENFVKRERAQVKLSNMKELHSRTIQRIVETESEYHDMENTKKVLDGNIMRMNIYEKFLAKVVVHFHGKFSGILDIIKRYDSLMQAQIELTAIQEMAMKQVEKARRNFDKLVADKYVQIACLKTKLSDVERRYEIARSNCQKWENIHHVVTLETQKKLTETQAVKDSCWQIYKDICDRKGVPAIHKDDYPRQFEAIKKDLLQRKLVNEKIAALEEEKLTLSEKACASSETG